MSLADTLISIFIFVLITGAIIGIFIMYKDTYAIQIAYNELSSNNSIALNKITKNIRQSNEVIESHTINSTLYETDYDTLVLKIPSIDGSDNIITDTFDYLAIHRNPVDSTLLRYDLEPDVASARAGGIQLLSEFVDKIIFNYNDTVFENIDKIETILVTIKLVKNIEKEIVSQTTTGLRN
ncbi:MAG: hypothetical protein Q8P20_02875 [bacterium]|nr:hypothetical protein [bacterium]